VEIYQANQSKINLVLIDAAMTDWDGLRTLHELQRIEPSVVACLLFGDAQKSNGKEMIADGAARVIRKPFEPSKLARTLWELVGERDRRTDSRRARQSTRVKVGVGLEPEHVVESWIGDQSPDGLRLRLPEKVGEVGALLSIRAADAEDDQPWIPVQIRHIRPEADMWTAGCRFLHPAVDRLLGS
jgi:CheY-like chemotaxis protein